MNFKDYVKQVKKDNPDLLTKTKRGREQFKEPLILFSLFNYWNGRKNDRS